MKEIPRNRKNLYYTGMALSGVGFVLFLTFFVMFLLSFGNENARPGQGFSIFIIPFLGILLIIGGNALRVIGARGTAGAGLILNPSRAKEDLEPWARMGGGLVNDAMDEAGIKSPSSAPMAFDEKLRRLGALKSDGLLSDAEYQTKRREILAERI